MPKRTAGQNRQIHGLLGKIRRASGLSREDTDDIKRQLCREASGQDHSSQLTQRQANRVIAQLADMLPAEKPKPAKPDDGPRLISPRQQEVIGCLFRQAGLTTRQQQMGFCRRQFGQPWPQRQRHVDALMTPLREMVLRKVKPADVRRRALALQGRPELDAWQVGFIDDLLRQFNTTSDAKAVLSTHKVEKLVEAELACGLAS